MEAIPFEPDYGSWQKAARHALQRELPPSQIVWQPRSSVTRELELFTMDPLLVLEPCGSEMAGSRKFRVPREFIDTAKLVACHRDDSRWSTLYRVLWRLLHDEGHLLRIATDPDVIELSEKSKAVRRDVHKMRAFVRFREVTLTAGSWFVAWFEPHHLIVELNSDFFVNRFASMNWSILTPDRCAHWNGRELSFTPGVSRDDAPTSDAAEKLWLTYYRSIFNPARVKVAAIKNEMPLYYWKNLPEAALIGELLAAAPQRTAEMVAMSREKVPPRQSDFPNAPVPLAGDWNETRLAAETCRACPLWRSATCVVFGEGPSRASVVIVGEQPGDQEDRIGQPFVGPAGRLLNRALQTAGLDRDQIYVTNAVKHFKWEPQGKRRLHQKPNAREIAACRPWLEKEIDLVRPKLIVSLGATAAYAVTHSIIKVTANRGSTLNTPFGISTLVTVHPSSLLRQPDRSRAEADFAAFVADLKKINQALESSLS